MYDESSIKGIHVILEEHDKRISGCENQQSLLIQISRNLGEMTEQAKSTNANMSRIESKVDKVASDVDILKIDQSKDDVTVDSLIDKQKSIESEQEAIKGILNDKNKKREDIIWDIIKYVCIAVIAYVLGLVGIIGS